MEKIPLTSSNVIEFFGKTDSKIDREISIKINELTGLDKVLKVRLENQRAKTSFLKNSLDLSDVMIDDKRVVMMWSIGKNFFEIKVLETTSVGKLLKSVNHEYFTHVLVWTEASDDVTKIDVYWLNI